MRPRFHTAEDSDEPRFKMVLLDEFARQGFLADIGGIQIAERSSGRLSHFNGLGLDALRQVSGKVFKVLKEEFFDRQQRLHGLGVVERWQRGPAKKNSCPFVQFLGKVQFRLVGLRPCRSGSSVVKLKRYSGLVFW